MKRFFLITILGLSIAAGAAAQPLRKSEIATHSVQSTVLDRATSGLFNSPEKSSLSVAYILPHDLPAGSIVGPVRGLGGWGYPKVNHVSAKITSGAEELVAFTKKEIGII